MDPASIRERRRAGGAALWPRTGVPGSSRPRPALAALAAALFVLASCAGPSAERKQEATARMQMGIGHLNQRDIQAAMKELAKASELDPENPEIDMALGLAYQARGDVVEAEKSFRAALRKRPDYPEAHNNLGFLLSRLGRSREAIREYESAAANVVYATPEVAYTNLGEEYRRLGELDRAETMYRRALAFNPRYTGALRGLAALHSARGRWDEAAKELEQAVAVSPEFWAAWMELGAARARIGNREGALKAYRTVLSGATDPSLRAQAAAQVDALERGRR